MDFYFGILFQVFTALMLLGFLIDMNRQECHDDPRYQKMSHVAQVIMFLAAIHSIFQIVSTI